MRIPEHIDVTDLRARIERAFQFAVMQLEKMLAKWPANQPAPIHTRNGVWHRPQFIWTDWCPGFYAGMMWLGFEQTGNEKWRQAAEQYTRALERRKFDRYVHDLGFIFMSTVDRWYRLLGDDDPTRGTGSIIAR